MNQIERLTALDYELQKTCLCVEERRRFDVARSWRDHGHAAMAERETFFWRAHETSLARARRNLILAGAETAASLDRAICEARRAIEAAVLALSAADPLADAAPAEAAIAAEARP